MKENFKFCGKCREIYDKENLRFLTDTELNLVEESENEQHDNDSCYKVFEEDELYCFYCIENCLKNL